ncbi:hypothetical protein LTS12_029246, partial [Elasticomyces elasticus]
PKAGSATRAPRPPESARPSSAVSTTSVNDAGISNASHPCAASVGSVDRSSVVNTAGMSAWSTLAGTMSGMRLNRTRRWRTLPCVNGRLSRTSSSLSRVEVGCWHLCLN